MYVRLYCTGGTRLQEHDLGKTLSISRMFALHRLATFVAQTNFLFLHDTCV